VPQGGVWPSLLKECHGKYSRLQGTPARSAPLVDLVRWAVTSGRGISPYRGERLTERLTSDSDPAYPHHLQQLKLP